MDSKDYILQREFSATNENCDKDDFNLLIRI